MSEDIDQGESKRKFLRANANSEFIGSRFADLTRDLMRSFASRDGTSGLHDAAQRFAFILDLLGHADAPIVARDVIAAVLDDLRSSDGIKNETDRIIDAARAGLKFLVESSCHDTAANGRASRQRARFGEAVDRMREK